MSPIISLKLFGASPMSDTPIDTQSLRDRFAQITSKRESLVRLLEQPDLGTLRIDVNQAIEEIDDLIDEFNRTFPAE
jgi:hypothetical protein